MNKKIIKIMGICLLPFLVFFIFFAGGWVWLPYPADYSKPKYDTDGIGTGHGLYHAGRISNCTALQERYRR